MLENLELAKSFASAGDRPSIFRKKLMNADPKLRRPILREYERFDDAHFGEISTPANNISLYRSICSHFIQEGIFTNVGRPSLVGMILDTHEIDDMPIFLVLGESRSNNIHTGRCEIYTEETGGRGYIAIHVSEVGARLMQVLDFWLSEEVPDIGFNRIIQRLSRLPEDNVREWFARANLSKE